MLGPFCWSLYTWFSVLTALLKLTNSNSSTLLPAVISPMLAMQDLSGNEVSGTEQMLYMHEDAVSISCISNRAPKRLNNSFINHGLQVQLFLQSIRNSAYGVGPFACTSGEKAQKCGGGPSTKEQLGWQDDGQLWRGTEKNMYINKL